MPIERAPLQRPFAAVMRLLGRDASRSAFASATDEDRARLEAHGNQALARNSELTGWAVGLANLVFWPSDLWNLAGQPEVIHQLARGRLAVAAVCASAVIAIRYVPPVRRHLRGVLSLCMFAGGFALGDAFARLSPPSGPWFHFTYLLMLMPLVGWATLPQRIAVTALLGLSTLVGYFGHEPEYLHDPIALVSISHMGFAVALSIGAGGVLDLLRRESYLVSLVVRRQADEVSALNARLESRVREQTAELRHLANRLEVAREAERAAIARDLHDELGQELTALRYAVEAARTRFTKDPAGLGANLAQVEGLVARTTTTTRQILTDLRPRVLDDLGLFAAVEWLVERLRDRVPCTLTLGESEPPLVPETAATAFRVVQEATTNVLRHASATACRVEVRSADGGLRVEVVDDGAGFEMGRSGTSASGHGGIGLLGMRERVAAAGGRLELDSAPGRGTRVTVWLPSGDQRDGAPTP